MGSEMCIRDRCMVAHEIDLPRADEDIAATSSAECSYCLDSIVSIVCGQIENYIEVAYADRSAEHPATTRGPDAFDSFRQLIGRNTAIQHGHIVSRLQKMGRRDMSKIAGTAEQKDSRHIGVTWGSSVLFWGRPAVPMWSWQGTQCEGVCL